MGILSLSETHQSQKDKHCTIYLLKVPRIVKLTGRASRIVVARDWEWGGGGGDMENWSMDRELQFCEMECSGDGLHNNVNMSNTTELHTYK